MLYKLFWTVIVISSSNAWGRKEQRERSDVLSSYPDFQCDRKNEDGTDIHCYGKTLAEIPKNLSTLLAKLTITDCVIVHISRSSFDPYRQQIRDITLSNMPYLRVIEEGTFANMPELRTVYISYAPRVRFLHGLLKGVTSSTFYSLRIVWTRLTEIPELVDLPTNNTMFLLDLDHNHIERIPANSIRLSAQQVTINFNRITTVEDYAFNGSQISELYMHSNHKLHDLGEHAFAGVSSLRLLDLSHTSVSSLPVAGLEELETLKLEGTPTLETIPSIYDFGNLREARLTHSFHCCAFKYPAQHNPEKHAQFEQNMKNICKVSEKSRAQGVMRKRRHTSETTVPSNHSRNSSNHPKKKNLLIPLTQFSERYEELWLPLRGKPVDHENAIDPALEDDATDDDDGFFHSGAAEINDSQLDAYCGKIIFRVPEVECFPEPNALNPCEDIMGVSWLRISVWCVLILAIFGNLAVIIVVFFSSEITVSKFLICNLAFADLCMGLYLLLIASMDYHSVGVYFNFAFNWQYGVGCQIAGFLTVFASHLSVYTLTIVTLERWFTITYAIHLTKRITLRSAKFILIGGWIYSIMVASLPLIGVSNYSSTSICLPMESNKLEDKAYLFTVFITNSLAFAMIVFCYVQMYLSLGYETRRTSTKGEMTIAKKMALLIFVDFATVAPIAFFGLTALVGYPLIGVTESKILLVFFYPLNACANPYLYAVMTAQYRRDLHMLISRCGICKRKPVPHKLTDVLPLSNPVLTNTQPYSNGNCEKHGDGVKAEPSYV